MNGRVIPMRTNPERKVDVGELDIRGKRVRFGIKERDRSRHMYVIGQTGSGKSTLLEILAQQDLENGSGFIFIDPHGQSVENLLNYVPEKRLDDVIYFAPHLQDQPLGLNIVEDIGYDKRHLVVNSLLSSFERIWEGTWSDRMSFILQNTLLALIEHPNSTLLDIGRMYSSKNFRKKVVDSITDPQVKNYWETEFKNYTQKYIQEATPAIQNKVGQFTSNPLMRNIIGQPKSSFNFRSVMDSRKILLINLSKGKIGDNNARMLGTLFTTKIYLAALSRSDLTRQELEEVPSCSFYVDEFQSFSNSSFADILSEARKYKLNLILAHQYIAQLDSGSDKNTPIRDAVFGNVGTFISFRIGSIDADVVSKQFSSKVSPEDLVSQPNRHMYVILNIDGAGSQPFSAQTFQIPDPPAISFAEQIEINTQKKYGTERSIIEKRIKDTLEEDWKNLKDDDGQKNKKSQKGKRTENTQRTENKEERESSRSEKKEDKGSLRDIIKNIIEAPITKEDITDKEIKNLSIYEEPNKGSILTSTEPPPTTTASNTTHTHYTDRQTTPLPQNYKPTTPPTQHTYATTKTTNQGVKDVSKDEQSNKGSISVERSIDAGGSINTSTTPPTPEPSPATESPTPPTETESHPTPTTTHTTTHATPTPPTTSTPATELHATAPTTPPPATHPHKTQRTPTAPSPATEPQSTASLTPPPVQTPPPATPPTTTAPASSTSKPPTAPPAPSIATPPTEPPTTAPPTPTTTTTHATPTPPTTEPPASPPTPTEPSTTAPPTGMDEDWLPLKELNK